MPLFYAHVNEPEAAEIDERPLYAGVAVAHVASQRVLEKVGFVKFELGVFNNAAGDEVQEQVYRLGP